MIWILSLFDQYSQLVKCVCHQFCYFFSASFCKHFLPLYLEQICAANSVKWDMSYSAKPVSEIELKNENTHWNITLSFLLSSKIHNINSLHSNNYPICVYQIVQYKGYPFSIFLPAAPNGYFIDILFRDTVHFFCIFLFDEALQSVSFSTESPSLFGGGGRKGGVDWLGSWPPADLPLSPFPDGNMARWLAFTLLTRPNTVWVVWYEFFFTVQATLTSPEVGSNKPVWPMPTSPWGTVNTTFAFTLRVPPKWPDPGGAVKVRFCPF